MKTLKDMTITELKAYIYDQSIMSQQIGQNIQIASQEIIKRKESERTKKVVDSKNTKK